MSQTVEISDHTKRMDTNLKEEGPVRVKGSDNSV